MTSALVLLWVVSSGGQLALPHSLVVSVLRRLSQWLASLLLDSIGQSKAQGQLQFKGSFKSGAPAILNKRKKRKGRKERVDLVRQMVASATLKLQRRLKRPDRGDLSLEQLSGTGEGA